MKMFLFAVVLLFAFETISGCDYPTFKNTSVTVVGVRGVDKISGCLEPDGALEKASYIQIINQSIPVLYSGAIRNLPNLVDAVLDNNGIIEINAGAFYNLPKLQLMRLENNNIEVLKNGVFNNLMIKELHLMNNSISVIDQGTFNHMPQLTILNLDKNRLSNWNGDWFLYTPTISNLSFKSNQLKHIPKGAFRNLKGFHIIAGRNITTNINFDDNLIETIDPNALEGLNVLGWLFLSKNKIRELDENLLDPLENIDWLKLSFNQLSCVPDKIIEKIPTVTRYIDGNPLSDYCRAKIFR